MGITRKKTKAGKLSLDDMRSLINKKAGMNVHTIYKTQTPQK